MKKFTFITVLFSLLHLPVIIFGATHYVDTSGSDSRGDGSKEKPWRSVSHALNKARSGDVLQLADGTYNEGQLTIPVGVSLRGNTEDNTAVTVRPKAALGQWSPLLSLESTNPGSTGDNSISYITFTGLNGSNRYSEYAFYVKNRSNVRIHHCRFLSFMDSVGSAVDLNPSEKGHKLGSIESTSVARTHKWWTVWPKDSGVLGDDSSIDAMWPEQPVENFEFDNNTVTSCYALRLWNLKNSSIHDNVMDNSQTYEWTIRGTAACLWNVDIFNNTFLANPHGTEEGDPGNSIYTVELWVWRGGSEIYNNTTNAFFSLTYGKETKVYNNTLSPIAGGDTVSRPNAGKGLELLGQSYLEAYGNYVANNNDKGIVVGHDGHSGNQTVRSIIVRNNVVVGDAGTAYSGIGVGCAGRRVGHTPSVTGVDVFNNVIYGTAYSSGIKVDASVLDSDSATLEDVFVKNNIMMNIGGSAGKVEEDGTIINLVISNNLSYGCGNNGWVDAWTGSFSVFNQIVSNPLFVGPTNTYAGFALSSGSPAIDAGVGVGLLYNGTAVDIGAIEMDGNIIVSEPAAPNGLKVFFD